MSSLSGGSSVVIVPGLNQLTSDSGVATASSNNINVVGGTGINTSASGSTLNINLDSPVAIANGGTNATSMANTDGVVYFDGTRLVTTAVGTATHVLTSNGAGMAPTFQAAGGGGGITTINGDSGSATGAAVTFNANTNAGKTVTFSGSGATISLNVSDGSTNTCVGFGAGNALAGGSNSNATFGYRSGAFITTGQNNLGLGYGAFCDLSLPGGMDTGSNNIAIGRQAGNAYTNENSNILIGNNLAGVGGDAGVIRIGTGSQTTCFIQGINGVTVTGTAVLCATDGQLGTVASSIRYKDNVVDMADTNVMKLRPVNFTYKKSDVLQYGLIAEEVEEVFKDLVFYSAEGKPESVHYEKLPAILLHELQKQNKRIEALEALLAGK